MREYVRGQERQVSCRLARVEVLRAVRGRGTDALSRAREVVAGLDLIQLDDALLDTAVGLPVPGLRSLDAIHLAAALSLGDELSALVTYDDRMARAARLLGLEVVAPR